MRTRGENPTQSPMLKIMLQCETAGHGVFNHAGYAEHFRLPGRRGTRCLSGGTFEALHKHGIEPDWLAGISIGAINSVIIAGSDPEHRVRTLREFWDMVSSGLDYGFMPDDHLGKRMMKDWSVLAGTMTGIPGFFSPRLPTPYQMLLNPDYRISHYDTEPLIKTLDRLVDFDRIHRGNIRVSLGAVNVRTGNFAYFDTRKTKVTARHVAASGALPPASRLSKSTANTIGMAASSPTRRCNMCWGPITAIRICASSRSISSPPEAACHAIFWRWMPA